MGGRVLRGDLGEQSMQQFLFVWSKVGSVVAAVIKGVLHWYSRCWGAGHDGRN